MTGWNVGFLALAGGLSMAGSALATGKAHVHGQSQLNIASESTDQGVLLQIELVIPGADLVGFEYKPETAAEKQALDDAMTKLSDPASILIWPVDAGCSSTSSQVISAFDDHHDDTHDHDQEHEHEHAHDAHEHVEEGHSEHRAVHAFSCSHPEVMQTLEISLFDHFAGAQILNVAIVSDSGQRALTANREAPILDLDGVFD